MHDYPAIIESGGRHIAKKPDCPMVGGNLRVRSNPENDLLGYLGSSGVAHCVLLLSGRGGSRSRAFSSR
jgi:hypothetical protein